MGGGSRQRWVAAAGSSRLVVGSKGVVRVEAAVRGLAGMVPLLMLCITG